MKLKSQRSGILEEQIKTWGIPNDINRALSKVGTSFSYSMHSERNEHRVYEFEFQYNSKS